MRMNHRHHDQGNEHTMKDILHAVNRLNEGMDHMALIWERLEAKVAALKTVEDSLIALLKTYFEATKDAVQNAKDLAEAQTKIDALETEAQAQVSAMADAVAANTPAGPGTPPPVIDPVTGLPVDPNAPVIDPTVPDGTPALRRRR